jgi:methanethiol S-methyltransferase
MGPLILGAAILLWGVIHSLLAGQRAKDAVIRFAGQDFERAYRLAYNVFAALSFLPILVLLRLLPDHVIYAVKRPWLFVMLAGQAAALVLLIAALLQTGVMQFAGIRQLVQRPSKSELNTKGFYGLVRHPLYLFGLLFIWLTPVLTINLLTTFAFLSMYLFVGARFEERRLLQEFGEQYAEYSRHTPMIIPGLPKRRADLRAEER